MIQGVAGTAPGRSPGAQVRRLAAALCLLLALLPPARWLWLVSTHSVDVPWHDEWQVVAMLGAHERGELGLGELVQPMFEQRHPASHGLLVLAARLSDHDVRVGVYLIWAAYLASLALVASALRQTWWVVLPLSAVIFDPRQHENALFSYQLCIALMHLAVVGCLVLLDAPSGRRVVAAATFSFAAGMLVWPLGLLVLARQVGPRSPWVRWWGAAMVVAVGAYLSGPLIIRTSGVAADSAASPGARWPCWGDPLPPTSSSRRASGSPSRRWRPSRWR